MPIPRDIYIAAFTNDLDTVRRFIEANQHTPALIDSRCDVAGRITELPAVESGGLDVWVLTISILFAGGYYAGGAMLSYLPTISSMLQATRMRGLLQTALPYTTYALTRILYLNMFKPGSKERLDHIQVDPQWTLLHFACCGVALDVVRYLARMGANPNLLDSQQRNALDLARGSLQNMCVEVPAVFYEARCESEHQGRDADRRMANDAEQRAQRAEESLKELVDLLETGSAFSAGHFAPPNGGAAGAGAAYQYRPG